MIDFLSGNSRFDLKGVHSLQARLGVSEDGLPVPPCAEKMVRPRKRKRKGLRQYQRNTRRTRVEVIEDGIAAQVGVPVEVGMAPHKGVAGEVAVAVESGNL